MQAHGAARHAEEANAMFDNFGGIDHFVATMRTMMPPNYHLDPADVNSPAYASTFPEYFQVGSTATTAFVDVTQVKGHLALLGAFASLRTTVEDLVQARHPVWLAQMPEEPERRWTWFAGRAVER